MTPRRTRRLIQELEGEGRLLYKGEPVLQVEYRHRMWQKYLDGVPGLKTAEVDIIAPAKAQQDLFLRDDLNAFELELEDGRRQKILPKSPGVWRASGGPEKA